MRPTLASVIRGAAGVALLTTGPAIARDAPFTLDQVMGAPYPSSLVAAPRGDVAAWVSNARGVRNIWVAAASAGPRARAITGYTADDGNDLGELAWSPDARLLAFTRGQTLEDDGPANVASAPAGPSSREIWTVPAAGGTPRRVGAGHDPSFSPDGTALIFLDKRSIMAAPVTGGAPARPLLVDEGAIRSAAWSPDGKRLVFVSQRKGHTLVGVLDRGVGTVTWLAPGFDNDATPAWSPDGTQVAFVRQRTEKAQPFIARREGLPWSIWVADVATGIGRPVWTAERGRGSVFHPTLSANNLLWTATGQLVFPWERTGWVLPYAVASRGGAARPLAMGAFETAYMTLSPDRRALFLATNQGDIDRLHVWRVDPEHGPATALATGEGIEAYPAVAADGTVFALRSEARAQLAPVALRAGRWQALAPGAPDFPAAALTVPQSVTFKSRDGLEVHGQLFLPPGGTGAGRHPAVLFFHGGPPRQMLTGFHYMGAYSWMYGMNQYLAARGYVVLSVNYRGGIGYGLDYREAKDFGPGGGSEANDITAALDYLDRRGDVDRGHVGIWGGSYGGLMTALGLARASDRLAVGVDYAGVYDWPSMFATEGAPVEDAADRARATASSPVATIDRWRSPVLVVHADDDRNVPFQQSAELVQDLLAHGIPHDELVLPNEVHDLTRWQSWMTLFRATDAYLGRYLLEPKAR